MTTRSDSELSGTADVRDAEFKLYLAQTGPASDLDAELEAARKAHDAAKVAAEEASRLCIAAEEAEAWAEISRKAAEDVEGIDERVNDRSALLDDGGAFERGEIDMFEFGRRTGMREEIDRLSDSADAYAESAEGAAERARIDRPCGETVPMSSLESPPAGALAGADMRDASHPDHARFSAVLAGVVRIDEEHGRTPDASSERLAAALTVQSKADGLEAVRHVAMNAEGTRAFATDTQDPASALANRSVVDVAAALRQTVEASNERLGEANRALAMQAAAIEPEAPARAPARTA